MQRRDLNAPNAPLPVAAYTQAIEVSGATRTLYISGQVGQRVDGTIPDDIVEQSRLAWQNLEAQLKAAGMTLDNLVKITTILPISPPPAKGAARCWAIASRRAHSSSVGSPTRRGRSKSRPSLSHERMEKGSAGQLLLVILQTEGFSLIQRRRAMLDGNLSERLYSRLAGRLGHLDRVVRNLFPPEEETF
jgi:enamine deaminase RidA (YjgF/YER057c/UK114 family)